MELSCASTQTSIYENDDIVSKQINTDFSGYVAPIVIPDISSEKHPSLHLLYKGSTHYFPGSTFYSDISTLNTSEVVKYKLYCYVKERMFSISENLQNYFGSFRSVRVVEIKKKRFEFPCPEKKCQFRGYRYYMVMHLISKYHNWQRKRAELVLSLYEKYFEHTCLIFKSGVSLPTYCKDCKIIVWRFDRHCFTSHPKIFKDKIAFTNFKKKMKSETKQLLDEVCPNKASGDTCNCSCLSIDFTLQNKATLDLAHNKKKQSQFSTVSQNVASSHCVDATFLSTLQKNAIPQELYSVLNIDSQFKYFYKSNELIFQDFSLYLQQYHNLSERSVRQNIFHIKDIWRTIDPTFNMELNAIGNANLIEEKFVLPNKSALMGNENFTHKKKTKCLQASTIRVKLGSLRKFIIFLKRREIFAGITWQNLDIVKNRIDEQNESLSKLLTKRETELKELNAEHLITREHLNTYMNSDHIKNILKNLNNIQSGNNAPFPDKNMVTDIRNYLMFNLVWVNALRTSNLINFTIADFYNCHDSSIEKDTKIIYSKRYKTSSIYGRKLIVLKVDLYNQIKCFIEKLRGEICKDHNISNEKRYVFTSSSGALGVASKPMDHCVVSMCLTTSFKKANVFEEGENLTRISPSRIRKAVATELVENGEHSVHSIANSFMMHNETTSKRYYIQKWNETDAFQMANKCNSMLSCNEIVSTNGDDTSPEISISNSNRNFDERSSNVFKDDDENECIEESVLEIEQTSLSSNIWYSPRKYDGKTVMEVLYVLQHIIDSSSEPSRELWEQTLNGIESEGIHLEHIHMYKWHSLRNIVKAMWKKYRSELIHTEYNQFLATTNNYIKSLLK